MTGRSGGGRGTGSRERLPRWAFDPVLRVIGHGYPESTLLRRRLPALFMSDGCPKPGSTGSVAGGQFASGCATDHTDFPSLTTTTSLNRRTPLSHRPRFAPRDFNPTVSCWLLVELAN